MNQNKIEVTLHQRRPGIGLFSLERLFNQVTLELSDVILFRKIISPYPNIGLYYRFCNILHSYKNRGSINHITGDVHFLNLLIKKNSTILTILDCVNLHRLKGFKRLLILFFWYWLPIKRSSKITVISEFTKKELLSFIKIDPNDIEVVHCCIPDGINKSYKIFNMEMPRILQIGTAYNKNLKNVIGALQGITCILVIVGFIDDAAKDLLKRMNIKYENYLNVNDVEIIKLYQESDLLMFASTYEGFGMPILEANAVGRPVITSNLCSMPEVAGDAALLVDPYSIEEIREATLKIINSNEVRVDLIEKGFKNILRFSSRNIANKYREIYEKINFNNS